MRSVVVLQADGRRHPGALRAPMVVGIWRASPDRMAVAIKTCLSLAEQRVVFAPPEPFSLARAYELHDAWLATPHDWAAPSSGCCIYVVGHAHAVGAPRTRIDATLELADWRLTFAAVASAPATEVPLVGDHVQRPTGPLRLAPMDACDAPAELQLPAWPREARLSFAGLSARAEKRELVLPPAMPRLFIERGVEARAELPLRCDGAVLDTDLETLTQWWRAEVPLRDHRCDRMMVFLDDADASFAELARDLPRGTVAFAAERSPLSRDDDELDMARHEALVFPAEPELELAAFAAIAFALSAAPRSRVEVLAEHDLDERAWTIEERAWTERLEHDANEGDGALLRSFAAVMSKLQAQHQVPEIDAEALALVHQRISGGEAPHVVLAEAGLTPADWLILQGR